MTRARYDAIMGLAIALMLLGFGREIAAVREVER
jgi:hypothetical protein